MTIDSTLPSYMLGTTIVRIIVMLVGTFWIAQRTPIRQFSRLLVGVILTIVLSAWIVLIVSLARNNVFRIDETTSFPPPILGGVVIPILVGYAAFRYWRAFRQIVSRIPQVGLIGIQAFRITGGMIFILYLNGRLPAEFAIPAGIGDLIIGITAIPIAYFCWVQKPWAHKAATVWNYAGIVDFMIAVPLGILTSPSPIQLLALDAPNVLTTAYPLVLFPAFSVPAGIILHLYSLALLRGDDNLRTQGSTPSNGWRVMTFLAIAASAYATLFYLVLPNLLARPIGWQVHPLLQQTFAAHPIGIYMHVVPSIFALLLGPFQFRASFRQKHPRLHRVVGRVYLLGILVGGLGGLFMAQVATGGLASRVGFSFLAVLWLFSGGMALLQIRRGDFQSHQEWMIRNYALTLAAVTLRFYTRTFFLMGMDLPDFHSTNAWLCWVPNLIVAEWLIRRMYTRAQTSPTMEPTVSNAMKFG